MSLTRVKASVAQLFVSAAFSHPDVSFQLKSYTCSSTARGGLPALTIAKEVKFGFHCGSSSLVGGRGRFRLLCLSRIADKNRGSDSFLPCEAGTFQTSRLNRDIRENSFEFQSSSSSCPDAADGSADKGDAPVRGCKSLPAFAGAIKGNWTPSSPSSIKNRDSC